MKRFVICITMLFLFSWVSSAQRGLNCFPVFKGKIVPTKRMVVMEASGEKLADYQLYYYHSVCFKADGETAQKVARLIQKDAAEAQSAEIDNMGNLLTYSLIQPKPYARAKRYLCYQARPEGHEWVITIIYLEGNATLEDLRYMFEK